MLICDAIRSSPFVLGDLIRWPSELYPERIAVRSERSSITFATLAGEIEKKRELLLGFGLERFQRWGLLASPEPEFFIFLFAMLRMGVVVAIFAPGDSASEIVHRATEASVMGLVLPVSSSSAEAAAGLMNWRISEVDGEGFAIATSGSVSRNSTPSSPIDVDPALILWSSGSGGKARGVVLQHGAIITNLWSNVKALELQDSDRTLVILPLSHAYGLIHQAFCHLAIGASVFLSSQSKTAPALCRTIEELEVTTLVTSPSLLKILLKGLDLTGRRCSSVRLITVGTAPVDDRTLQLLCRSLPLTRIALTYGLTEAGPRVATRLFKAEECGESRVVGYPNSNVEVQVRDDHEIWIRGSSLMRSYAADFWEEGRDHCIRTSDLGTWVEGMLLVTGRRDRTINRGGELVAAEAIEQALLQHPAVEGARVDIQTHEFWGQVPKATIFPKPDAVRPTIEELKKLCRNNLGAVGVPVEIIFEEMSVVVSHKERQLLVQLEEHYG